MKLDKREKQAVRELGDAVNVAVEQSEIVVEAMEKLHKLGLEANLLVKLEIGLQRIENFDGELFDESEPDFTDEDIRTLQRMKIKI